ncbi:MAG: hypothetical protein PQ975_01815 [Methanobacterium sp.]|jgi:hypothetical protein
MPSALKDNSFLVDLMGGALGLNPLFSTIPGNSFSIQSYTQGKSGKAAKKSPVDWQYWGLLQL